MPILIVGAIAWPVVTLKLDKDRQTTCLSNLKQLSLAMLQYAQDYDERLPLHVASKPPQTVMPLRANEQVDPEKDFPKGNWRRAVLPYIRSWHPLGVCPATRDRYSYEYNSGLGGKSMMDISDPGSAEMVFDRGYPKGPPPPPHSEGWNVAYTDGYVRWVAGATGTEDGR